MPLVALALYNWMDVPMLSMNTTDSENLEKIMDEGRKRGYVRRSELEAVLHRSTGNASSTRQLTQQQDDQQETPETVDLEVEELEDLDEAVEQLLAADVDIVDNETEEARVQEDEAIESSIQAMETDSAPLIDLPDEAEAGEDRLRRVQEVARAADRGEATEVDAITAYLREIGRVAMLSHAQEIDLAQRIEAGDKTAGSSSFCQPTSSGQHCQALCRAWPLVA